MAASVAPASGWPSSSTKRPLTEPGAPSRTTSGASLLRSSSLRMTEPTSRRSLCGEDDLARMARLQAADLEGVGVERLDACPTRLVGHSPAPRSPACRRDRPPAPLRGQAAGQLEIHREDPGVGRDVDELVGVIAVERDGVGLAIADPADPLPLSSAFRRAQVYGSSFAADGCDVRRSSRGRAGRSARTSGRPAGRTPGRRPRWSRYRQLDVVDIAGPDGPAGRLVDQPPGHDHPRGHLDRRLDRLEPLGVVDDRRVAEERVDPRPRVDAELIELPLGQAVEAEAARGVGPGGDGGMRRRVGALDDGAFDRLARPLQADDADDRLGRAGDVARRSRRRAASPGGRGP